MERLQSRPGTGTSDSNCDDSVGDHSLPNIHTGDRHKNVDTHTNSDHSDSTWSDSPDNNIADDIITFNKNHFIVQDLGMGEMLAEGKSKVHIHVNTKSEFKWLIQRLIVKVGKNKGWDVLFGKIPLVEIPKIDNLLQGNGCVVYTDIALDKTGDDASKCEHITMNVDVESKGDIVQQSDVGSDVAEKPKCSNYEIESHVGSDKSSN